MNGPPLDTLESKIPSMCEQFASGKNTLSILKSWNTMLLNKGPSIVRYCVFDILSDYLEKEAGGNFVHASESAIRLGIICLGHAIYKVGARLPVDRYKRFLSVLLNYLDLFNVKLFYKYRRATTSCFKSICIIIGESRHALDVSTSSALLRFAAKYLLLSHEISASYSDSELSDSTSKMNSTYHLDQLQSACLNCIVAVSSTPANFMPHFYAMCGEKSSPVLYHLSSSTVSLGVRKVAATSLQLIIANCFKYLSIATIPSTRVNFTTHSESIGISLINIHSSLIDILDGNCDQSLGIVGECLICVSKLIRASPYERLAQPELLLQLQPLSYRFIKQYFLESLLIAQSCFQQDLPCSDEYLDQLIHLAMTSESSIQVEIMHTLSCIRNMDQNQMNTLQRFISDFPRDNKAVGVALACLVAALLKLITLNKDWVAISSTICLLLLNSDDSDNREAGLKIAVNFSSAYVSSMDPDVKEQILDIVLKVANDPSPYVQASSFKCIGSYLCEGTITEVFQVEKILGSITSGDHSYDVQIWAFWCLASVFDAAELVSALKTLLYSWESRLLKHLRAGYAKDKLRISCLRILSHYDVKQLNSFDFSYIETCLNSSNHKVLWNACRVVKSLPRKEFISSVIVHLKSPNAKVRTFCQEAIDEINAAEA